MQFAKYWKKEIVRTPAQFNGPAQLSVWGASNENEELAAQNARNRARQFIRCFSESSGNDEDNYEYSTGFIREEVIEEILSPDSQQLAVITRNRYGATVLNTNCVLFGDIDVPNENILSKLLSCFGRAPRNKSFYVAKIEKFQLENAHLSFIVYETYAGLRFVISNKLISPNSEYVKSLFEDLPVDRLYTRLCKQQVCFRARLSPKPWRIGSSRPPNQFPRKSDKELHEFKQWLTDYKMRSAGKVVTKRIAQFGDHPTPPEIKIVLRIHDKYTCARLGDLA